MIDVPDRRDVAINEHREREAPVPETLADQEQQRTREQPRAWINLAFPAICHTVTAVGADFARRGSSLLFVAVPGGDNAVHFEIRRNGNLAPVAHLQFDMADDGQVHAATDAAGVAPPHPVPVGEVSSGWVEQVAEQVMIAALGDQTMPHRV
jgi:hypothetical protein